MIVSRLELLDFRNYVTATFDFHPGITAVVGLNGQGKTNLAEAMAYLATLDSFRGAPGEALIRNGSDLAVVRATVVHPDGREVLVELELSRNGRNRYEPESALLRRTGRVWRVVDAPCVEETCDPRPKEITRIRRANPSAPAAIFPR